MLSWYPWTGNSIHTTFFREFSHQLIFYTHSLRIHVGLLFTHPWILSWKQRKNAYPQYWNTSFNLTKDIKKWQVFDFTLACRLKGLNLQLQNSAALFFIFICFPWMTRKSSRIHCLWSAFLVWCLQFCAYWNRLILILGTHQRLG